MARLVIAIALVALTVPHAAHAELRAGAAAVDITDRDAGPVSDPLFAKALVLQDGDTKAALITVDAVAIGTIGRIRGDYLPAVRKALAREHGIAPGNVIVNASHCHGVVRRDAAALTVEAVRRAAAKLVPVRVGAGTATEGRISENRRLKMKDGSEIDMRRAYALPPDGAVAGVGPIDPQVGVLRVDRADGTPLAVVYNFACHPIMGTPDGGNTADFPGYASKAIEDALGGGAVALFVQGAGGDINPVRYKTVSHPHDTEPRGNRLGLSVVRALKSIKAAGNGPLKVASTALELPRATDFEQRIAAIDAERDKLVASLRPTDISFKTFVPLLLQQKLSPDFPSYHAQGYLHDEAHGHEHLPKLDSVYRANVERYVRNIHAMEQLTRLNVNRALLVKHLAETKAAGSTPLKVEVAALRVGDFRMVTFPGELTVQVGLNIKKAAPHPLTFVAGYTNGYIYYTPTAEQRRNTGFAQEDCDCLVGPGWQKVFESKALEMLRSLR